MPITEINAHDRRRHQGGLLVSVGSLPGLPDDQCNRLANTRPSSRRGGDKPHSRAVMPIMPAECAVRRARTLIADKYRRRNARGAQPASARRVASRLPLLLPSARASGSLAIFAAIRRASSRVSNLAADPIGLSCPLLLLLSPKAAPERAPVPRYEDGGIQNVGPVQVRTQPSKP